MGQILHGSATTTHAIRAAIQRSKASIQALSERYGINPKTVAKWRKRTSLEDQPMGPKVPHSTVLSADEETLIVAFRRHTLLPLDDCLYALQATVPHLTRSVAAPPLPAPRDQPAAERRGRSAAAGVQGLSDRLHPHRYRRSLDGRRASSTCSSPSIGSASSPSRNYTNGRPDGSRRTSCAG